MPGPSDKKPPQDWIYRILITVDTFVIISGYLSYYQVKRQLISPLIPRSTVAEIWYENSGYLIEASIISAGLFLAGLWCYSLKRKSLAIGFLAAVPVYYYLLQNIF